MTSVAYGGRHPARAGVTKLRDSIGQLKRAWDANPWFGHVLFLMGFALLASLPFRPLFYQNQNHKYLYGLAQGGFGRLQEDWLVAQGSNLPIFDAVVLLTERFAGLWMFHGWRFLTVLVFAVALYGIARTALTNPALFGTNGRWFLAVFGTCFAILNSNNGTGRLFEGFAHQYVSGHVFEPASFGVLAVLGLLLFRLREPGWAIALVVAAAWVHPAYAISGLLLLAGMTVARWRFGSETAPLPIPVLLAGIVGCCGSAAFIYSQLHPIDPPAQAEAVRILTTLRIPHHTLPEVWLDFDAAVKIVVLAIAISIAWRDPLGAVILTVMVGIAATTLWVYVTRDLSLALAFPWRASAVVVPAANAILLGRGIELAVKWSRSSVTRHRVAIGALSAASVAGLGLTTYKHVQDQLRHPPAYFSWVRDHAAPGQLYLTSVGEASFRLLTGQPQYVNWNSHPFRAPAVLEWYRRVEVARQVTSASPASCETLSSLGGEGVTHVVRPRSQPWSDCPEWRAAYSDDRVSIWERVSRTAAGRTEGRGGP